MAPSSSAGVATVSSLDTLLSQLISPQRIRSYFLNNPKGRYVLVGTIAAIVAAIAEHKRRSDNRDEVKRKVPHRRNSAVHLYDGMSGIVQAKCSYEIFVPYKDSEARVVINPIRPVIFDAHKRLFLDKRGEAAAPIEGKVGLNRRFLRQFGALWAIIVPRINCKEVALLLAHFFFLIGRTWLSLVVARLDGAIVRDLVAANGKGFAKGLIYWFLIAIPASYNNAMIRYLQAKLSIAFRTRLTRYVHDLYLNSKIPYYKVPNLDGGITGIDQYITTDIARFCDTAAALYSTLGKPTVDMVVFNYQLYRSLGLPATILILANYAGSTWLLRKVSPAFGRLAAVEARLEGEYRNAHSRLITNAEEIAFYKGADIEMGVLNKTFTRLMRHINGIYKVRVAYNMFEDFLIKYAWSAFGLILCSFPTFVPSIAGAAGLLETMGTPGVILDGESRERMRTGNFITNKRLMLSLADAGGRLLFSYKDLAELAGYTSRIYALLSTLHRIHADAYFPPKGQNIPVEWSLADIRGTVQEGYDGIRLEGVPIVAPAGQIHGTGEQLIDEIDMIVHEGEHTIISGPNGVGKTGVARVIAGLWPVFRGLVSKPKRADVFYIPQRPYLSMGTLRDQIIYPDSHADMVGKDISDQDLEAILDLVKLEYIPAREGGWETRKEWKDVFSGGEKQRIGMARMFYHKPRFAVLDEATSAVSQDVEAFMYERAKAAGITLVTISHRPTLLKYHQNQLRLGTGEDGYGWELQQLSSAQGRLTIEKEIAELEELMGQVDGWKARRQEIETALTKVVSFEESS